MKIINMRTTQEGESPCWCGPTKFDHRVCSIKMKICDKSYSLSLLKPAWQPPAKTSPDQNEADLTNFSSYVWNENIPVTMSSTRSTVRVIEDAGSYHCALLECLVLSILSWPFIWVCGYNRVRSPGRSPDDVDTWLDVTWFSGCSCDEELPISCSIIKIINLY